MRMKNEIIFNGGDPIGNCPRTWDEAYQIQDKANFAKDEFNEPLWKFDCGFKLDFDGPLVSVSSRFYPPKSHYSEDWDGCSTIYILDKKVVSKEFKCVSFEELKQQVEAWVESFKISVESK